MKTSGAILVSWDFSHGADKNILLVGERENGQVNIINAFQGPEAKDLYEKLTSKKNVKKQEAEMCE